MLSKILSWIRPVSKHRITGHAVLRFQQRRMMEAKRGAARQLRQRLTAACNAAYLGIAEVKPLLDGKWRIRYKDDQFVTTMHPMNRDLPEFKVCTCYPN